MLSATRFSRTTADHVLSRPLRLGMIFGLALLAWILLGLIVEFASVVI